MNRFNFSALESVRAEDLRKQFTVTDEGFPHQHKSDSLKPNTSSTASFERSRSRGLLTSQPTSSSLDYGESLNMEDIAELQVGTGTKTRKKSRAWKKLEKEKAVQRQ